MKPSNLTALVSLSCLLLTASPLTEISQGAPLAKADETTEATARLNIAQYSGGQLKSKIRSLLASLTDDEVRYPLPLPATFSEVVIANQPESGEVLLSIIGDPEDTLHRQAVKAFTYTWNSMNVRQIDAYLQRAIRFEFKQRKSYPGGSGAMIEMGHTLAYLWDGWPRDNPFQIKTKMTHFVDGTPYRDTYSSEFPLGNGGWLRIDDFNEGSHTTHFLLEYEFTHQGVTHRGRLKSKTFTFDVLADTTPDDLKAPLTPELEAAVRAAFHVGETNEALEAGLPSGVSFAYPSPFPEGWAPQLNPNVYTDSNRPYGEVYSSHVPSWGIAPALPVDLFFDVEIQDLSTGNVFRGVAIEIPRGQGARGLLAPYEAIFEKDAPRIPHRDGFIPLRIVLKPSRARALSRTWTTQYYPGTLVFEGLRAKLYARTPALPGQAN